MDLKSCFLLVALCAATVCNATQEDLNLLRTNPNVESTSGTDFAIGFFGNNEGANPSEAVAVLYIGTKDPEGADVTIEMPNRLSITQFPMQIKVDPGTMSVVRFPVGRDGDPDIRVTSSDQRVNGIHVFSTNGAELTVAGVNDESVSTDAFLALPCKDFKSGDGRYNTNQYKYFVFSTAAIGTTLVFNSRFLIVPCTDRPTISYRLPGATSNTPITDPLNRYDTFIVQRSGDLTGTVITSNAPLAVFVGHECGQVPSDITACDHLVEQVPPHAAFGTTFFALPFALRESGDIFKVGSVVDDNDVVITCSRRSSTGVATVNTLPTVTINEGGFHEFRTFAKSDQNGLSSDDYRREFCCIETSKPAIVMQYSLGHSADLVNLAGASGQQGDPAMSLVPPVTQYRNNFLLTTADQVRADFRGYMSWAISSEFFNPETSDPNNFLINDTAFLPPPRHELGSQEYVSIYCQNGEVCGYGAFSPLASGTATVQYDSAREPNAAVYTSVYGFLREISFAYPAGYECEPIGLPHITVFDITVRENVGVVTVTFERTGGDLSFPSRIGAMTVATAEGGAVVGSDFVSLSGVRIRWQANQRLSRHDLGNGGANDVPFTVTIIDDDIPEPTEYFEVHFEVQSTGYAYPSAIGRVTILDNDGDPTCTLQEEVYNVNEEGEGFVEIVVQTTDPDAVGTSCVLSTQDITAVGGSVGGAGVDYQSLSSFPVVFASGASEATVQIAIANDDQVENTEQFSVVLSSTNNDVLITPRNTATVNIIDTDVVSVGFNPVEYSVSEGAGFATLTIVKVGEIDRDITLSFSTQDDTAISLGNADFTAVSGFSLVIAAGASQVQHTVPITDDTAFENPEQFFATISLAVADTAVRITDPMATVEIVDDDRVKFRFDPASYSVSEADGMATLTIVQFDRAAGATGDITVLFSTADGTAEAGSDYQAVSQQSLLFSEGTASLTVDVPIINDDDVESPIESFTGNLQLAAGVSMTLGLITVPEATVDIVEDDAISLFVQFDPVTYRVVEGMSANLRIVLSQASTEAVSLQLSSQDISTSGSADYSVISSMTITFAAGETEFLFPVGTVVDSVDEGEESFRAVLSGPVTGGASLGSASMATVFITDPITVQFQPAAYSVNEGETVDFMIFLSSASTSEVTVDFATGAGTALAGSDYTSLSQTVTFAAGELSQTVTVSTLNDNTAEPTEQFQAFLSNPLPSPGVVLGGQDTAVVDILDDEVLTVQFDPISYSVNEGQQATLTAVLSFPASIAVSVQWSTEDDTALAIVTPGGAGDYTSVLSQTITFPAGQTTQDVFVSTAGDSLPEITETFGAVLSSPNGNGISFSVGSQNTAAVDIEDDDSLTVQFQPAVYTVSEGDQAELMVVLSMAVGMDVTVQLMTVDDSAMAGPNGDYTAVSQTITFLAGQTTQTVPVNTRDDSTAEPTEVFEATLSSPNGNGLAFSVGGQDRATVNIEDNDSLTVQFVPDSYTVIEGNQAQLMLELSGAVNRDVSVQLRTMDGSAEAGLNDYTAISSQTVTFPSGQTTRTVTVSTLDDPLSELVETFTAQLFSPNGNGLAFNVGSQDTATVNIMDNDPLTVQFVPASYTVTEGDQAMLVLQLSGTADRPVSVDLRTVDMSAIAANNDYTSLTQTITFPAGQTSQTIPVSTLSDGISEPLENFRAELFSPSGNGLDFTVGSDDRAIVNIEDNNPLTVQFVPATYMVMEGEIVQFIAELSFPSTTAVSVQFNTGDDTAFDVQDYMGTTTTLSFPAGTTQMSISIPTTQDVTAEEVERFMAFLSSPSAGLTLGDDSTASATIQDDDVVSINFDPTSYSVTEGDTATLMLVLSSPSDSPVTVQVLTNPGSALENDDYMPVFTTVTFAPGATTATVDVITVEDSTNELAEMFTAVLQSPTGGAMLGASSTATVTIMDDDVTSIRLTEDEYRVNEDGDTVEVCVERIGQTTEDITVSLNSEETSPASAAAGEDFVPMSFQVTIPADNSQGCVEVPVTDDDLAMEGDEVFQVTLGSPPAGVQLESDEPSMITIVDDDIIRVSFTTPEVQVSEDDPTGETEVCLEGDTESAQPYTVQLAQMPSGDNPATDDEDYDIAESALSITFPAGAPTERCVEVTILDDDVALEEEETLAVLFETLPEGVEPGDEPNATVTIVDDDELELVKDDELVSVEGGDPLEFCVESATPIARDVTVRVDVVIVDNGNQFVLQSADAVIQASVLRDCVAIVIINDDKIALQPNVTFQILVTVIDPPGASVDLAPSTLTVVDDDILTVSFEQLTYNVMESAGPVEVCLVLNCQAAEAVTVTVIAGESSPPDARDVEDFRAGTITYNFPSGLTEDCQDIPIVDDDVVEDLQENFMLVIDFVDPDEVDPTAGDIPIATVVIRDDDELSVTLTEDNYEVNEDEGTVEICVERIGESAEDITVTISAGESTPASAEAGEDFTVMTVQVTILASESEACADFPITDDDIALEPDEVFEITLTTPADVPSSPDPSTVTIIDDDVVRVSFTTPEVQVSEDDPTGETEVCLEGDIESAQPYTVQLAQMPSGDNPATDGTDYNIAATSLSVSFPAGEPVERCVPVDIVDDDESLEEQETLTVSFATLPEGVEEGDDPTSTVSIVDDDNAVPLLLAEELPLPEDAPAMYCVERSAPAAQDITLRVQILGATSSDLSPTDFELILPASETMVCQVLVAVDDKIALEQNVTYEVRVTIIAPPEATAAPSTTSSVTIVDNDVLTVSFEQPSYSVTESAGQVEACVVLNCEAAQPVTVSVSANSAEAMDVEDFIGGTSTLEFAPGETEKCEEVTIVDDDVVEELEEDFLLVISSVSPDVVDPSAGENPSATVTITDDDDLSVRLTDDNYEVNEDEGTVEICVERIGQTTEDIPVSITATEASPVGARDGEDFTAMTVQLTILASESEACADVPITDDELALEGDELFEITLTTPPDIPSSPDPSTVTIIDDDGVAVSFTTPTVVVNEDVPEEETEVCFEGNTSSARPYQVMLLVAPSGQDPATEDEDYSVDMADLSVTVPAGDPAPICVPIDIIDDQVALEEDEMLTVLFGVLDEGVVPGDPDEAEVTIVDDDDDIEINFVSEDVMVNEDNGTVFVCVERDMVTQDNLTVPVSLFTTGTADSSDFEEIMKEVTFKPFENETCAEVSIVDDNTQELPETFMVGFGAVNIPGVLPGTVTLSVVTIIDDDQPVSSQCSISEPLTVSPFNSSTLYNFRGTCELIALMSCNETEPDFSVRVDFLSNTASNGAVGVFLDGLSWISREDGSFSAEIDPTSSPDANTMLFSDNDVTVRMNASESRTEIQVGGAIDVTVIHYYGDSPSISLGVGAGSSLLESCGICGTQSGQLLSLNGSIATTPSDRQVFVESYRVPAAEQSLRPMRAECSEMRNDTVIGDPLFTVPYLTASGARRSLCYEIHGQSDANFNLISDQCVSINAHYIAAPGGLNIIDSIGIRAQDEDGVCRDIQVDLDRCDVSAGTGGSLASLSGQMFRQGGIFVRPSNDRVRVSLPNGDSIKLILWVICERGAIDMIRFQIARGINLKPTSHGLLGQFWSIPVSVQPYTPVEAPPDSEKSYFNVTVTPQDSKPRSTLGDTFLRTWDNSKETCVYVGNSQGGPSGEFFNQLSGSVIEGSYKDYMVEGIFDTEFKYSRIEGSCAAAV